jgi:deoxyribodipyrimidine photo-lyase
VRVSVVWFRLDLRVSDHSALTSACKSGLPVIAIASTQQPRKLGKWREQFYLESLADLASSLSSLGIPLIVEKEEITTMLDSLAKRYSIANVYCHDLRASEELRQTGAVKAWSKAHAEGFVSHQDHTLLDTRSRYDNDLFTSFRKQIEPNLTVAKPLPVPAFKNPSLNELIETPAFVQENARFCGGETEGQARIKHYLWDTDSLASYKQTRNGMLLDDDSSKFSPWLAHGCVSARQIYHEVRRYEQERTENDSTYWMIFELLWREFFLIQLGKHGNKFFQSGGIQGLTLPWRRDEHLYQAWKQGRTGFPLVDAAMRELHQTGYLSNRARQNVASFFCKNLGLDWRLGASYFEEQLVDYDVASNWGNWMYQAGVGNDAREFRLFNLDKQATQYDSDGAFRKHYCPELNSLSIRDLLNPTSQQREQFRYPKQIVNFEQSARENRLRYEQALRQHESRGEPW